MKKIYFFVINDICNKEPKKRNCGQFVRQVIVNNYVRKKEQTSKVLQVITSFFARLDVEMEKRETLIAVMYSIKFTLSTATPCYY